MYKTKEAIFYNKRCYLSSVTRKAHANKAWGFYNLATICFIDDSGKTIKIETMGLGKFNKAVKWTGKTLFRDGQFMKINR